MISNTLSLMFEVLLCVTLTFSGLKRKPSLFLILVCQIGIKKILTCQFVKTATEKQQSIVKVFLSPRSFSYLDISTE